MERELAVGVLRQESDRILAAARSGREVLAAPVPTCPDWNLAELVKHLGRVYGWAHTIVSGQLTAPPAREALPSRPENTSLVDWMEERRDLLLTALLAVPTDEPVWNFVVGAPAPPSFWWRRQMHETLIHRVDAELAIGAPVSSADPAVAADGLSEMLEFGGFTAVEALGAPAGLTVHLHATDAERAEWTLDTEANSVTFTHAKGDVALRGTAWALDRWCWGRPADGELEVFGDLGAAEAWRATIER